MLVGGPDMMDHSLHQIYLKPDSVASRIEHGVCLMQSTTPK